MKSASTGWDLDLTIENKRPHFFPLQVAKFNCRDLYLGALAKELKLLSLTQCKKKTGWSEGEEASFPN